MPTAAAARKAEVVKYASSVIRGDFLSKAKLLGKRRFDVAIADPPYNIGKNFGNDSDSRPLDEYLDWTNRWIKVCLDHLTDKGVLYIYGFAEILAHVAVWHPMPRQRWLVWHYTNKTVPSLKFWQRSHETILCLWKGKRPTLNVDLIREGYTESFKKAIGKPRKGTKGRYSRHGNLTVYAGHENGALPRDVLKFPALAGGAGASQRWFMCKSCRRRVYPPEKLAAHRSHDIVQHPTQKPLQLTKRLIQSVFLEKGDVLIPFAGSGSECVVAQDLGLDFFATELNQDYVSLSNKWLKAMQSTKGGGYPLVMYRLTPRMFQRFRKDLGKYHDLFDGGRCSGWELEELLVVSIRSDTQSLHSVLWQEAGHDDKADITVVANGRTHLLQVKSGLPSQTHLTLSGYRLGRFERDWEQISEYLNHNKADFISVPYRQTNDEHGRSHIYSISYIDSEHFGDLTPEGWGEKGKSHEQTNKSGIVYSIRPSMSWQVWWKIPNEIIECTEEFAIP